MNFWLIAGMLIVGYALQFYFGVMQIKDFSKAYTPLRKKGRVAIGKVRGGWQSGSIVLIAIDDAGIILEGAYVMGVSIFARFKKLHTLEGKQIADLAEMDVQQHPKTLRKAILNATSNYNIVMAGGEIPKELSLFEKGEQLFKRKRTCC